MDDLELHDKVTLSSGKEFNCDYLATIPNGYCFISVLSDNIGEIAAAFSQNQEITYGEHVLTGYSFFSIAKEENGRYKVTLRKGYE